MNCIGSSYPFTPKRKQALADSEEMLRDYFYELTESSDPELKDAIHYLLFRLKDRLSLTLSWIIAQEIRLPLNQTAPLFASLEMTRCALGIFSLNQKDNSTKIFIERYLIEQASLCLIGLASKLLTQNTELKFSALEIFSNTISPLKIFSNEHKSMKDKTLYEFRDFNDKTLKNIQENLVCPFYEASGIIFSQITKDQNFTEIFKKIGLLVWCIDELEPDIMVLPILKNIETEILDLGSKIGIKNLLKQEIKPLLSIFNSQIQ
jgi:hypothetical protein